MIDPFSTHRFDTIQMAQVQLMSLPNFLRIEVVSSFLGVVSIQGTVLDELISQASSNDTNISKRCLNSMNATF